MWLIRSLFRYHKKFHKCCVNGFLIQSLQNLCDQIIIGKKAIKWTIYDITNEPEKICHFPEFHLICINKTGTKSNISRLMDKMKKG